MALENLVLDVIEGRSASPVAKGVCLLASLLFRTGVAVRHKAYDSGLFKTHQATIPVVSIGNIVAGGTGKTPLICLLAKELEKSGKVAILTRGYRGSFGGGSQPIDALDAEKFGDEPVWLQHQLPNAAIWVGKNRVLSAKLAAEKGASVLLLDDGMQHRALARSVEIVILDGEDLFGHGAFLPRGYLRDFPTRLKDAHLIIVNHLYDLQAAQKCQAEIARYSSAPVAAICYRFKETQLLEGKKVGAFCALGRPERFLQMLRRARCTLVDTLVGLDHRTFDLHQLQAFAERCKSKGAKFLVCTEKDGVKLPEPLHLALPVKSLGIEIEWITGENEWRACLEHIKQQMEPDHDRRV